MKSFQEIYEQIQPALVEVETFRQAKLNVIKKKQLLYGIPILIAIISAVLAFYNKNLEFFLLGGGFAYIAFKIIELTVIEVHGQAYEKKFKDKVLKAFIGAIYPNVTYESQGKIDQAQFKESRLFLNFKQTKYEGEDHFKGKTTNGNTFEFSELNVFNEYNKEGNSTTPIFKGLFFVLETNDKVNTEVFITPRTSKQSLKKLSKNFQFNLGALFSNLKMVYMKDHPEFEKEFVVNSKNTAEAYRILSPTMLDALYNLKYQWNTFLYVSFIHNKIFIALKSEVDYFRPNIHLAAHNNHLLKTFYAQLANCFAVIEDLSDIEKIPLDYHPEKNWSDSAYKHLLDDNSY